VLRLGDADWQAMSNAAWRTASRYSWDDAAALFEQALHRAIDRAPRPANPSTRGRPVQVATGAGHGS
jgi:hypothetical protein